jgi:DNA-binding transcriptional MocR family regulator
LAGSLGLNRATVSAAYELLESAGLIKGHVGRGSFVADSLPPRALSSGAPGVMSESEISFASSRPSSELFPIADFQTTAEEVISSASVKTILQLGSPYGYAPLRRYLHQDSVKKGLAGGNDEVMITSGCQQALDLIQRVIAANGETVLIEDPVYPGIRNLFQRNGARVVGVPMAHDGIDLELLERAIRSERPRLMIVTPNFQNPTGATLPLESRVALLRIIREHGVLLIENDTYGDLRYHGTSVPTLRQLDDRREVILLRSFSKIAFPGLRVGWVIGPRPLISRLADAKQWSDLHTDQLSQAVLLRFAESGRLERHKEKMLAAGAARLEAALDACTRCLPEGSSFTRPEGGMNLWIGLPEPLDAGDLLEHARRENVAYLPGKHFAVSRFEPGTLRISFAGLPPDQIRLGLATLGKVFSTELRRIETAHRIETAPAMV